MYLVELRPGKEELYRSSDELAAAIRNGDVDRHSRIYHRATSKWISVTLHPQFKAIVAAQPAAAPPPAQAPPLERANWTFFNAAAETLAGSELDEPVPPVPAEPLAEPEDQATAEHPYRRPLALCVTGGFLILGIQLATSGPRPPWAVAEARRAAAPHTVMSAQRPSPDGGTVSLASSRSSYAVRPTGYAAAEPGAPAIEGAEVAPAADSVSLPAAPRVRVKRALREALLPATPATPAAESPADAGTVSGLIERWSSAHDSARVRLETGMRVVRLNQLFAAPRLTAGGGVTETRMSLAGVANFVRVFRQQQVAIDREYQDSFAVASKQFKWSPAAVRQWNTKPRQTEASALVTLSNSLMAGIDSVLGVLDAQAGTYTLEGNAIRFEDPAAAREYTELRQRIASQIDAAKAAGAADGTGPMAQLLRVIGTTRLPPVS